LDAKHKVESGLGNSLRISNRKEDFYTFRATFSFEESLINPYYMIHDPMMTNLYLTNYGQKKVQE
jgi:hypothetical protein